ncbi:MAG: 3-oxoacyl-ACP reductase FabG [Oscillospiraceae bacterium]|nr:3-oxoacyl-ACP reductase FabG [Oscillospiraceae bacterium]
MEHRKTAVVTGASRGIGRAIATALFHHGWNVVCNYHKSGDTARALAEALNGEDVPQRAIIAKADVSDPLQVEGLFQALDDNFSTLDLLVNNAGIAQQKLFTDLTETDWRTMMGVHLDGAFYCSQQALRRMIPRHTGRIVNVASMWGQVGASCEVHYSAAKAGLIGMTKALAKEVGPSGITVNCVCPGVIQTEMNSALPPEILDELREETPLCALGTPENVAEAVLFFSGDGASFLTGQVLGVNGGLII